MQNSFKGVKLFFVIYFAVLMLVLTFVGVMGYLGYEMIDASIKFVLFGLLAGSAMIAGAWWIVRRIMRRWLKVLVGVSVTALVLAIFLGLYLALSFVLISATPLPYAYIGSPSGKNVVILRQVSTNADFLNERIAAAGGDPAQGPQTQNDLGYAYRAYPIALNFFYNKKADVQGAVEIGMASAAELDYRWLDEDTLHMSALNPQSGDGGECTLRLN